MPSQVALADSARTRTSHDVEGKRLRFDTFEGPSECGLIDGRPDGVGRLRVEAFVGGAIALQRLLDQLIVVRGRQEPVAATAC